MSDNSAIHYVIAGAAVVTVTVAAVTIEIDTIKERAKTVQPVYARCIERHTANDRERLFSCVKKGIAGTGLVVQIDAGGAYTFKSPNPLDTARVRCRRAGPKLDPACG